MRNLLNRIEKLEGRERGPGTCRHVVSQMINETEKEAFARYCKSNEVRPEDEVTYLYGAWIHVDRDRR